MHAAVRCGCAFWEKGHATGEKLVQNCEDAVHRPYLDSLDEYIYVENIITLYIFYRNYGIMKEYYPAKC